jgi:hypothetical protein
MKKYFVLTLALFTLVFNTNAQQDEQDVKQVVTSGYIEGIHNGGPIDNIRKGFHPSFNMLRFADNQVKPLSIEEWIKNIEANRTKDPAAPAVKTEGKFISVTVAGTSANVVLELYRDGKKIFTDNLLLYKFAEGWRIVSKTFYRHP